MSPSLRTGAFFMPRFQQGDRPVGERGGLFIGIAIIAKGRPSHEVKFWESLKPPSPLGVAVKIAGLQSL